MAVSRGNITPHRLFSVRDLGLDHPERHVDRVVKVFLGIGDAIAAHWIQMPDAIVLLQMVPENPASRGNLRLRPRASTFTWLSFEGSEDNLTLDDFSELLAEYNLLRYAEQPGLLQARFHDAASA